MYNDLKLEICDPVHICPRQNVNNIAISDFKKSSLTFVQTEQRYGAVASVTVLRIIKRNLIENYHWQTAYIHMDIQKNIMWTVILRALQK